MEIIKIFKGGFINKQQISDAYDYDESNNYNKDSPVFNLDEYIFKEKLDVDISTSSILKQIILKLDESIIEVQKTITKNETFLRENPKTENEKLLEKAKLLIGLEKADSVKNISKINELKEQIQNRDPLEIIELYDNDEVKIRKANERSLEVANKELRRINQQKVKINSYLKKIESSGSFDSEEIDEKELKLLFTNYTLQEQKKFRMDKQEEYKRVFRYIVPFQLNDNGEIFSFINSPSQNIKYRNYLIILENKSVCYEVYKNYNTLQSGHLVKIYLLNNNFTIEFYQMESKEPEYYGSKKIIYKKEGYIPFNTTTQYNKHLIESKILNDKKFIEIINYYLKYLGEPFNKWIKFFGSWDRGITTVGFKDFHFHSDVNLLQCFIINNNFRKYNNIYIQIIEDNYDTIEYLKDKYKKFELEKKLLDEFNDLYQKNLKLNENKIYSFIHTLETLLKKGGFLFNDNLEKIILSYFVLIESTLDADEIIVIYNIINFFNKIIANDKTLKIIYIYNFLTLNTLYRKCMDPDKSWSSEEKFFDNIKKLNQYIKLSIEEVKCLFLLEFIEELYSFYKMIKLIKTNYFVITLLWFLYFKQINDNPLVNKLTNIYPEFQVELLEKNFSNLRSTIADYNCQKFYDALENKESALNGYTEIIYDNAWVYRNAIHPVTNELEHIPYCGEICLLNFIMVLIYDKKTKKLQSSYLPSTTLPALSSLFEKYDDSIKLDKGESLIEYYNIIENINYGVVEPWDRNFTQKIYKRSRINESTLRFEKGHEYRLTYFNICRACSYLFNLTGSLELRELERKGVNKDTLKEIISNFRNPNIDAILQSYQIKAESDTDALYCGVATLVTILEATFRLAAGHSYPEIKTNINTTLKDIIIGYGSFYDFSFRNSRWDMLDSISVAIAKEQSVFSQINFQLMLDEDIIRFFNILKDLTPNYNIPLKLIHNLIRSKKKESVHFIFHNFIIVDNQKWYIYIYNIIKWSIDKLKDIIPLYLKNAILKKDKITGESIMKNSIFALLIDLPLEIYKEVEPFINKKLYDNNLYLISFNEELLKYLLKDISVFSKQSISTYIIRCLQTDKPINYEFLKLFDKTFFENKKANGSLIGLALKENNYEVVNFILSKKINLPLDGFNYTDSHISLYDQLNSNIFCYVSTKKMYDIIKKYIDDWLSSSTRTVTEIEKTTTLKIFDSIAGKKVILENCSKKYNYYHSNKPIEKIIEHLESILDFVIHLTNGLQYDEISTLIRDKFIFYTDLHLIVMVKKLRKYLTGPQIVPIFNIESTEYDSNNYIIKVIDEYYKEFKIMGSSNYITSLHKEKKFVYRFGDTSMALEVNFDELNYFPLILDLFKNKYIALNLLVSKIKLIKSTIDSLTEFFRKEENQQFLFTKDSNLLKLILSNRYSISYDKDYQPIFIRLLAFTLKYIFKSSVFIHCTFSVEKKDLAYFLNRYIYKLLFKEEEYDLGFIYKIINTIVEKNNEYLLSLNEEIRNINSFINISEIKNFIIRFHILHRITSFPKDDAILRKLMKNLNMEADDKLLRRKLDQEYEFDLIELYESEAIVDDIYKPYEKKYNNYEKKYIKYKNKYLALLNSVK
jgi:hypothetical protein